MLLICWFCHRPISVPTKVNNVVTDTIAINPDVRMCEQSVRCSSCGARYTVETYLDHRPTVSNEMLARIDNRPHQ